MASADVEPVFKKKSRSRPAVQRKRALEDDDSTSTSEVVRVARPNPSSAFAQGSTGLRRAKRARAGQGDDESSDEDEVEIGVTFEARKQEVRERSKSPRPGDGILAGDDAIAEAEKGLYKGAKAYSSQLPKGSARYGPIVGPENVRTITQFDFKPDICKDYRETGYCGFGDSCIFLHDRGDYLHGWQLDAAFANQQAAAKVQEPESDEEELPFACFICRETWDAPGVTPAVITKCNHFFHQSCAIQRYARNSKCAACGAATHGIFNRAEKIFERARKTKALRERGEEGQEGAGSDDEAGLNGVEGLAEG